MLEKLFISNYSYYLMGTIFVVGVIIKVITGSRLNYLVKEGREMNKSPHPFMKLVKSKFEHAFMVNGKVDNIDVFVDKFMREYKIGGLSLHVWSKVKVSLVLLLLAVGVLSTFLSYGVLDDSAQPIQKGATALILSAMMMVSYFAVDERYRLATVKIYMIDYLENILAKRLNKSNSKELFIVEKPEEKAILRDQGEAVVETTSDSFTMEDQEYKASTSGVTIEQVEENEQPKEDNVPTAAMLREILQEFMA